MFTVYKIKCLNISKNHHDISGDKNPSFGKKTSGSFKEGKEHPFAIPIIIDGILYESMNYLLAKDQ